MALRELWSHKEWKTASDLSESSDQDRHVIVALLLVGPVEDSFDDELLQFFRARVSVGENEVDQPLLAEFLPVLVDAFGDAVGVGEEDIPGGERHDRVLELRARKDADNRTARFQAAISAVGEVERRIVS